MDEDSAYSFTDLILKDGEGSAAKSTEFHCFEDLDPEDQEEIESSLYSMIHHGPSEYPIVDATDQVEQDPLILKNTANESKSKDKNGIRAQSERKSLNYQLKPSKVEVIEYSKNHSSASTPRLARLKTSQQSESYSITQLMELDLTADSPLKSKQPQKSPKVPSSKKKSLPKTSPSPPKRNPFSEYVVIEKGVPKSSDLKEAEVIDLSDDEEDSRCALIERSAAKPISVKTVPVVTKMSSDAEDSSDSDDKEPSIISRKPSIVVLDTTVDSSSSSSSSYDVLSSDDSDLEVLKPHNQMKLNITGSYESTLIANCSLYGPAPINWEAYCSRKWTPEMVTFYDKDGAGVDLDRIIQSMPRNARWLLEDEDRFGTDKRNRYFGKRRMLCLNCKQTDHVARNCREPKKVIRCLMCGLPGHRSQICPNRMCLGCGRRSQIFVECCPDCRRERTIKCMVCRLNHVTNQCPDLWRRYHSTVTGQELPNETPPLIKPAHKLVCSNCAGRGHISLDCPKMRWSKYLPVSPAVFSYEEPSHFLNNLTKGGSTSIATSGDGKAIWIVDNPQRQPAVSKIGNRIKYHIPLDTAPTTKTMRQAKSSVLKEITNVDINWWTQFNRMVVEFTGRGDTDAARTRFEKFISATSKPAPSSSPKKTSNSSAPRNDQATESDPSKGKTLSKHSGPIKVVNIRYTGSDNKMKRSSLEVKLTNKDKKKVGNRLNQFQRNHRVHITSNVSGTKWEMEINGKQGGNSLLAFKNILKLLKSASDKPTGH